MSQPQDMRAAVVSRYGPPERISVTRVPIPEPGPGQIRVRVRWGTVNRTDTATLRGYPFFARAITGLLRPRMQTLGMDFAGFVDALGEGVSRFAVGDGVFGMSPDAFGAHAEYLCVPAEGPVAALPAGIAPEDAVVCEGAWYANSTASQLAPGQRCLIYGSSGAIGSAAVQLARLQGAEITAVTGTRTLQLAADLGADRVIDYQAEDFTALGETFDLVFDAVGKTSWSACRPLIRPGGIFAATDLGPGWSNMILSAWFALTGSKRVRIPFPRDPAGFVQTMAGHLAAGRFRGVFDRSYGLDEITEAFHYVETGQKTGIVRLDLG